MNSGLYKKYISKSPCNMHEGKDHVDPDAPGTPGTPGFEPPVRPEDMSPRSDVGN